MAAFLAFKPAKKGHFLLYRSIRIVPMHIGYEAQRLRTSCCSDPNKQSRFSCGRLLRCTTRGISVTPPAGQRHASSTGSASMMLQMFVDQTKIV